MSLNSRRLCVSAHMLLADTGSCVAGMPANDKLPGAVTLRTCVDLTPFLAWGAFLVPSGDIPPAVHACSCRGQTAAPGATGALARLPSGPEWGRRRRRTGWRSCARCGPLATICIGKRSRGGFGPWLYEVPSGGFGCRRQYLGMQGLGMQKARELSCIVGGRAHGQSRALHGAGLVESCIIHRFTCIPVFSCMHGTWKASQTRFFHYRSAVCST